MTDQIANQIPAEEELENDRRQMRRLIRSGNREGAERLLREVRDTPSDHMVLRTRAFAYSIAVEKPRNLRQGMKKLQLSTWGRDQKTGRQTRWSIDQILHRAASEDDYCAERALSRLAHYGIWFGESQLLNLLLEYAGARAPNEILKLPMPEDLLKRRELGVEND